MIPLNYITRWRLKHPWLQDAQVEQDLIISRALVEIFSDKNLNKSLAFRGGTAIHKLYINEPIRYSEDIDLVQVSAEPFGETINAIRKILDHWLGEPKRERNDNLFKLIYRVDSESNQKIKLKIEVNTREHFSLDGYRELPFEVNAGDWFHGKTTIKTFSIEELLATKLRALYQRSKGRDLLDLWLGLTKHNLDKKKLVEIFEGYLAKQGFFIKKEDFLKNLEDKMSSNKFLSDTGPILAGGFNWNINEAKKLIEEEILSFISK